MCDATPSYCNTLQHTATHCNTLQHTATHCNTLQHTATHCNTLQHTATHRMNKSCDTTLSYVCLDSFVCVVHMCHSYVLHDSFMRVPRTIHMHANISDESARICSARAKDIRQHTAAHCNTLQFALQCSVHSTNPKVGVSFTCVTAGATCRCITCRCITCRCIGSALYTNSKAVSSVCRVLVT